MLGMVFFNGFFVLFCDVLSTLYLYFIHDLPLLSNFNGDLPIKNVWWFSGNHCFITFFYSFFVLSGPPLFKVS